MRDKIPAIIETNGEVALCTTLTAQEFREELLRKFVEEAQELAASQGRSKLLEELADVKEVYKAILAAFNFSEQDVEWRRRRKFKERGGFDDRLLLIETAPKPATPR